MMIKLKQNTAWSYVIVNEAFDYRKVRACIFRIKNGNRLHISLRKKADTSIEDFEYYCKEFSATLNELDRHAVTIDGVPIYHNGDML